MSENREHRIRQRAHAIWESHGQPHGSDREHWDQATREIDAEDGALNGVAVAKPAKSKAAKPAVAAPKPVKTSAPKTPVAKKPAKKAAPAS